MKHGFKICYREEGKSGFVRHFLSKTYNHAESMISMYLRYPPKARDDGHLLRNPTWKIIPVRPDEADKIWNECPF